jgi:hypothetical protein
MVHRMERGDPAADAGGPGGGLRWPLDGERQLRWAEGCSRSVYDYYCCYTGPTQPIRLLARDSNCEHPKLPPGIRL